MDALWICASTLLFSMQYPIIKKLIFGDLDNNPKKKGRQSKIFKAFY